MIFLGGMGEHAEEQKRRGRKMDARTFRRVAGAFRPYTALVILVVVTIIITSVLAIVEPLMIQAILDIGIGQRKVDLLVIFAAIMIGSALLSGALSVGQSYLSAFVGQRVMRDFRDRLYTHLQQMPFQFFTSMRSGEIQSRLTNDVNGVQGVVTNSATNVVTNLAVVISTVVTMLILSPLLTLISLGLLPLFLLLTRRVGKTRRTASAETQQSMARLTSIMHETLSISGILLIKTFGRQSFVQQRFQKENQKLGDMQLRQFMTGRWFFMLTSFFFAAAPAIIYLVGGWMIIQAGGATTPFLSSTPTLIGGPSAGPAGALSIGTLVAFTSLLMRFYGPVGLLLQVQVEVQGALALFDRIFEYLDLPITIKNTPHARALTPAEVRGQIRFKHVSFAYQQETPDILKDTTGQKGPVPGPINQPQFMFGNAQTGPIMGPMMVGAPPPVSTKESADTEKPRVDGNSNPRNALGTPIGITGKGGMAGGTGQPVLFHALGPTLARDGVLLPEQSSQVSEARFALKDISLEIQPGQLAALVGPSGAGKTTITYLVPRLYDVDSGAVEIDGVNVRDIALSSLGDLIGIVTQETFLFHASVKENLLFARPTATDEEIIAATQAAAIHERIMRLDDGYETIVGERGYKLSGGEKQRIAIARAILKNPRILILDEATSSLDTHSERLIQRALRPLMKNRTTLAIAHRLSTILAADVIFFVDQGQILETGTHQELLIRNGAYAKLYAEQFAAQPAEEEEEQMI